VSEVVFEDRSYRAEIWIAEDGLESTGGLELSVSGSKSAGILNWVMSRHTVRAHLWKAMCQGGGV
jgi:hypothetical protein